MIGSLKNINKVLTTGIGVNTKVQNRLVYVIKDIGCYYINEKTFKNNIIDILNNAYIIQELTNIQSSIVDYNRLVRQKKITVEPYIMKDPTIPTDDILPMIF